MQIDPYCECPDGQDGGVLQLLEVVDKAELARRVRNQLDDFPPDGSETDRDLLEVTLEVLEDPEAHEDDLRHVLEQPAISVLCQQDACEQR
ncbi:MAG: hypothetical protein ABIA92_02240 [Patescibacteria group bacterium]